MRLLLTGVVRESDKSGGLGLVRPAAEQLWWKVDYKDPELSESWVNLNNQDPGSQKLRANLETSREVLKPSLRLLCSQGLSHQVIQPLAERGRALRAGVRGPRPERMPMTKGVRDGVGSLV